MPYTYRQFNLLFCLYAYCHNLKNSLALTFDLRVFTNIFSSWSSLSRGIAFLHFSKVYLAREVEHILTLSECSLSLSKNVFWHMSRLVGLLFSKNSCIVFIYSSSTIHVSIELLQTTIASLSF